MKRLLISLLLVFGLMATPVAAQDRAVDDVEGSVAFIQKLGDDTIAILNDTASSKADRSNNFRTLFRASTDINTLTRSLLGRHYRKIRKENLIEAYQDAVTNYIISEFEDNIQLVGIVALEARDTRVAPGDRGELMVRTIIDVQEGDDIKADWRVQKKDGIFTIINLEVLGYNFVVTGRTLFAGRISELGYEGHLAELKSKYED